MKKYKVNIIWEAEIELNLNADNPQEDYCLYSWEDLFNAMKDAGIHEDVSFIRAEGEKED